MVQHPGDEMFAEARAVGLGAIDSWLRAHQDDLRAVRRHLHRYPEPSREEVRTTRFLAAELAASGIPHAIAPSARGLVAGPAAAEGTPIVAIRADIDALAIHDAKDVAYRSAHDGVMHACGHDAHAAMALLTARALWTCREALPRGVSWRAIFQPAEEVSEGAREMVAAGAMRDVRAIIALHVDPAMPAGRVGHRTGVLTARCQEVHVEILGSGGHAARPHQSVDPLAVASLFITGVYQFVPRSIDSRDPVVVTFGSIQGGTSPNVIPERVVLKGTVRTLTQVSAARVDERINQIALGLSQASGARIGIEFKHGTDAVVNDPEVTRTCARVAAEVIGRENLEEILLPSMGGEDFSGYLKHAPGSLLRLGVALADGPRHFLHSPHFDIDESALLVGARVLARSVLVLAEAVKCQRT